jgi:hypothetical protein
MYLSYDPKLVAISALGLACFALGFSVTAVAYPAHAHATDTAHVAPAHVGAPSMPSATRGCRLPE